MAADTPIASQRLETLVVGAAAVAAFFLVEYLNATFLHLEGFWRYVTWFTLGFVLIAVFVALFAALAKRLAGRA